MNPQVPSPIPPWSRPVQSPMVQICTGADTIDLETDVTYLAQVNQQTGNAPYDILLPNGNYKRQFKRIYVQGSNINNTAPFLVIGQIAGGNSLLFNNSSWSAVLEWDGTIWFLIGGNAQPSNLTS